MPHLIAAIVVALSLLLAAPIAHAQSDYPNRRIHIVLPYPAGGIVDIVTRIVAEKVGALLGQPIVIEPKPGANGNLAWDQVARAEPDGYTWTFFSPATMANPRMQPSVRWNEKSFTPVAATVWAPSVVVVHPGVPAKTMREFVEYARQNPGKLNWANPGIGTSQHLNTAIMLNATKLEMTAVPYRGQPPAIIDLLAGRVQLKVASIGLVTEHISAGTLKPLAVLGTNRSPLLPDVPTMSEAGYPEINVVAWYGYTVPKDTPPAIAAKINAAFIAALKDPQVRASLEKQALEVVKPMDLAEIAALVVGDTEKYSKVIKDANIRLGD